MEAACLVNVSAKPVGKAKIAELAINKFINVCQAVLITDTTTWKLDLVFATVTGPATIALKLFAVWIVVRMAFVNHRDVVAIPVGLELCANN